ncbi:uncharacterized protein F4812DRAFT_453693 [Daldinia caldariorum]|uniref:uncharacterized protein n=1 Tax=Daldinia caldariorum TaxID=326644 RepID=UPI002007A229|nr:uncharacterized protein F4812DRAFT_453693 [Daldinia caldariorum]KAI1463240.1 hypothetical protein F4812DRAFT_453693 [Daldinia caldariorum]
MHPSTNTQVAQPQLGIILRGIGELVEAALEANNMIVQDDAVKPDALLLRTRQSELLKEFEDVILTVQKRASKAIYDVKTKLRLLEDLPGIITGGELNSLLGCMLLGRRPSYKLRDPVDAVPCPQLVTYDDTNPAPPHNLGDTTVALQPTLRNVWVVQHAYATLLNYKEMLIHRYLAVAEESAVKSRKISREYYEDLSLAQLPSKNKLGNLLDVKYSSSNYATHDLQIVLVFKEFNGGLRYVEAVKGDLVDIGNNENGQYLAIPATETSLKNLYDVYRSLRQTTSEQRRATKDKEFAAKLPADEMDELQRQFSSAGAGLVDDTKDSRNKKRRRMLDDDGHDDETSG